MSVPPELIATPPNGIRHASLIPELQPAAASGRRIGWAGILLGSVLCLLALMPRLVGLNTYVRPTSCSGSGGPGISPPR